MESKDMAIETKYRRRADQFLAAERRYAFQERMVMHLRVAAFFVAAAMFVVGWNSREPRWWFVAGGVAVGGFSAAVAWHEYIRSQMLRNLLFRQVNEQAIARLRRDWKGLPRDAGRSAAGTSGRGRRSRPVRPRVAVSSIVFGQHAAGNPHAARLVPEAGRARRGRPKATGHGRACRRTWTCGKR